MCSGQRLPATWISTRRGVRVCKGRRFFACVDRARLEFTCRWGGNRNTILPLCATFRHVEKCDKKVQKHHKGKHHEKLEDFAPF